jgi:hypothetical protein
MMKYRQKLIILLSIISFLCLVFIFGLIFSPQRRSSHYALFNWLDPKAADVIEKITIDNADENITLIKKNNAWFAVNNEKLYPAKGLKAADLVNVLTRRASYPVRTNSASAFSRLGLDESDASRITVSGPYGQVILDLLAGYGDVTGQNIYLRKQGSSEVRSGEDKISAYLSGGISSWYNLRFVPETEDNKLEIDKVQRLSVFKSSDNPETAGVQIFSRKAKQWTYNQLDDASLDASIVDSYVRTVLYSEGDGFSEDIPANDPMFEKSYLRIELGTGLVKTIYISDADEDGSRYAVVSGTEHVYTIAGWMAERLFNTPDYFRKAE